MSTDDTGMCAPEEAWERRKDWVEGRDDGDPDLSHAIDAIWEQGREAWLTAYTEFIRVKAAAIDGLWDEESILRRLELDLAFAADDVFGAGALQELERRVKADTRQLDLEKITNARAFLRPFHDHCRKMRARPVDSARFDLARKMCFSVRDLAETVGTLVLAEVRQRRFRSLLPPVSASFALAIQRRAEMDATTLCELGVIEILPGTLLDDLAARVVSEMDRAIENWVLQ